MLQFITHRSERYDEIEGAKAALQGGCRWIQLRLKDADTATVADSARQLAEICRQYGAKLILDDYVELVEATGADGVHLGKMDMPVSKARKILGNRFIIGATANSFEDIADAVESGADYIGLGPYRYTTTKKRLSPILGLEGYRDIMERCRETGITLPVVAIGGITEEDIAHLMRTGITGVAVSGAILSAENPAEYTHNLLSLISENRL